jgi:hypothetical protein
MSVTLTNAEKQARYRPSLEWVALGARVAARQIRGKFFRSPERTMDRNVACSLIGALVVAVILITALIDDDSSIRHRNCALALCPRADE